MLVKKSFLISTIISLSILTSGTRADGLNCSPDGYCKVDVNRFLPSKNMPKKIHGFKNIHISSVSLTPLDKSIQVKDENLKLDILSLAPYKYHKQENEVLEPLTEEDMNTIIPSPEKFVATPEERELYYQQYKKIGLDSEELELIQPSLPMSLYYCLDSKEPIYDEKELQFNCIISG